MRKQTSQRFEGLCRNEQTRSMRKVVDGGDEGDGNRRDDDYKDAVSTPSSIKFMVLDIVVVDNELKQFEYEWESFVGEEFEYLAEGAQPRRFSSQCTVVVFGRTQSGDSIAIKITDFKPSLKYCLTGQDEFEYKQRIKEKAKCKGDIDFKRVVGTKFYGFEYDEASRDVKKHVFLQAFFPNLFTFNKMRRETSLRPAEGMVDSVTQFIEQCNIDHAGWATVQYPMAVTEACTHAALEVECRCEDLRGETAEQSVCDFVCLSFDIECISPSYEFPDATKTADEIVLIGAVVYTYNHAAEHAQRFVFVTGACDDVPGTEIVRAENEAELIREFRDFVVVHCDPDILLSYNGLGFDYRYLWQRAELLGVGGWKHISRFIVYECEGRQRELSSSQMGAQDIFIINMLGRVNIDLYQYMKTNMKLDSYKLDDVSQQFLGERKIELDANEHYKEMIRMCMENDGAKKAQVAEYCVQDCVLPIRLMLELEIFESFISMARITKTGMQGLSIGGQQKKVLNMFAIFSHTMEPKRILNVSPLKEAEADGATTAAATGEEAKTQAQEEDDSYEGATVIDPKKGFYKTPITALDFASLYPSVIRTHNLCPSMLVIDRRYDNLDGVVYETHHPTEHVSCTFCTSLEGVVPTVLTHLLSERSKVKKMMKKVDDKKKLAILNAMQLALKVCANSTYGFFGARKTGIMPCREIAMCTTKIGRDMIGRTVEIAESMFDATVVYGDTDSVFVLFNDDVTIEEASRRGTVISDRATAIFGGHIVLENEKSYKPLLLIAKKRYIGKMYEEQDDGTMKFIKLDCKGVEVVRRDNCKFAKEVYTSVMNALIEDMSSEKACADLKRHLLELETNAVDNEKFVLSKLMKKVYKNQDLPHLQVCKLMRLRNPGSEPRTGDRVPFVYVVKDIACKAFEKAEDPEYARRQSLPIDRLHYLESQVIKPVCVLLQTFMEDPHAMFTSTINALTVQQTRQKTFGASELLTGDACAQYGEDMSRFLPKRSNTVTKSQVSKRKIQKLKK